MKRLTAILIILLCFGAACRKTRGPVNGKSVQPNNNLDSMVSMSAVINGINWQTDSAFGYNVRYSGNDSTRSNLMITAVNQKSASNLSTISFNITDYTGPGEYIINPPVVTATYYLGNQRHFALKGNITVGSDTAYALKGTFDFIADSFTVATGVFNVALP